MKKLILTSAIALAAVVSFAQGTVNFANATSAYTTATPSHLVSWGATAADFNQALTAGGLVSSNFAGVNVPGLRAQLYYGSSTSTDLGSLQAVSSAPASFRSSSSPQAGSWLGGTRTLASATFTANPGDTVKLAIVVWDTAVAADPIATTRGLLWGTSGLFDYTCPLAGSLATAYLPANQAPFSVGFVPVPEPSTMALAGLAAAGLLIFRSRKSDRSHVVL